METTTAKAGQSGKSIEEVVAYAVGHRIRVHTLSILNEGVYSVDEIARIIGEPANRVSHHVSELLDAGSIELAYTKPVRNTIQHFYRAVEMPYYSDEEIAAMTPQERQVTAGLILQSVMAEAMSSFWAGKMHSDPRVWLTWDRVYVDAEGREALADEQKRSWDRIVEIQAESANRRAQSGEDDTSLIVVSLGFERERSAPSAGASANAE